jgi:sulfotransferase family protein
MGKNDSTHGAGRLPTFIGIGLAHAGSTWLHWMLKSTPVVLPRSKKETHFFDWHYDKGIQWYAGLFAPESDSQQIGEICNYFPSRVAAERIKAHVPECRIVCSLRDPVERAYSAYKFAIYNGLTRDPFEKALETNRPMTAGNLYGHHLGDWYEFFGKERVLVVLFDELRTNPQAYMDKVCDFLAIERIDVGAVRLPAKAVNSHSRAPRVPAMARKARRAINWLQDRDFTRALDVLESSGVWNLFFAGPFPPMMPETEARLRALYLPQIESAERLSGLDLSAWKVSKRIQHSALERAAQSAR